MSPTTVVTTLVHRPKNLSKKSVQLSLQVVEVSVMKGASIVVPPSRSQALNAVPLQNAVLCAECDVVSDSPHDVCMVCGSRSIFNIARFFGGELPKQRVALLAHDVVEISRRERVLTFPKPHRVRRRATVASRQLPVALDDNKMDEAERGVLLGP
jgi:hypothetical protein